MHVHQVHQEAQACVRVRLYVPNIHAHARLEEA